MSSEVLKTHSLTFSYPSSTGWDFPDVDLHKGDRLLVLGPSGSGKSTYLHLLAGLLEPSSGKVLWGGQDIQRLSTKDRDAERGRMIGLVFQRHHFIASMSVRENIALATSLGARSNQDVDHELLDVLGIRHLIGQSLDKLSEGEKQRVSIARALQHKPAILMADEPTSALDDDNCDTVMKVLLEAAGHMDTALLVVTHDARVKQFIKEAIHIVPS